MKNDLDNFRAAAAGTHVVANKGWQYLLAICVFWQAGYSQQPAYADVERPEGYDRRQRKAAAQTASTSSLRASPGFYEPNVIKSEGGVLKVELNVAVAPTIVAGRVLQTATYNASLPGPTLRVKPGDRMEIKLINNLAQPGGPPPPPQKVVDCGNRPAPPEMATHSSGHMDPDVALLTNIHTHGLQVSPRGNADNPYINLKPGETCNYSIQTAGAVDRPEVYRPKQPAGLYWYHPHRHMSTSKQAWAGLAGAIIVEGDLDEIPEVAAAKERLIVLQEL